MMMMKSRCRCTTTFLLSLTLLLLALLVAPSRAQCDGLTEAQKRHCEPYLGYSTDSTGEFRSFAV